MYNELLHFCQSEMLPPRERKKLEKLLNELIKEVDKEIERYRVAESPWMEWKEEYVDQVPYVCGVYLFYDATCDLIYVGSAGAGMLGERIQKHWREPKWPGIAYFQWIQVSNMEQARDLEAYLISKLQPHFNIQMK